MPFATSNLLLTFHLLSACFAAFAQTPAPPSDPRDSLRLLAEEERRRTIDPVLGTVPYERLDEARRQLSKQQGAGNTGNQAPIPGVTWQERGPSNIGGRTRTLLFDLNDATRKKVWAGNIASGLWYTNDITDANATWTPVSDAWENTVVTALAADPTNPQVIYAGTGDAYSYVTGGGIWKTTNGGTTWSRLSGTIPGGNYPSVGQSFAHIQRIVVNGSGQVFAATRYGVLRSTNGGDNWAFVLAPNQGVGAGTNTGNYPYDFVTDLDLATDGTLYAALNPSRLFKSTNGTNWTEITPPGVAGDRTELALAPSTSGSGQVIYAVSRAYNGANYWQDVTWFKKSLNGGATWTNLTIPTFSGGEHFTFGNGTYRLNLSVHPTDANTVYAGGYDWFRSTDGGNAWTAPLAGRNLNQQGLWFQPGSVGAAFADDRGIRWSVNWGNNAVANPVFIDRNNGYRASEVSSVSVREAPGGSYLLAGLNGLGYARLTSPGLSAGSVFWTISSPGLTLIDKDEPDIELIQLYQDLYRYTSTSGNLNLITNVSVYSVPNPSDYDSQSNTLYTADYSNGQAVIRKVTSVGTTPATTLIPLAGATNPLTFVKLGLNRNALFVGSYGGYLYKITSLNQGTPIVTAIDNGALPQNTAISSIDMGVSDDEILVTLSNYGVQSVWYTRDGGSTWTGKDQSNYGLPDVPVRTALFNPQNRQQVLLGTDAGIWSTNNITAANPGWGYTSTGMGAFRINQLHYRASDGRVTAATNGRGIFQTNVWAVPYTPSTITLTGVSNRSLCAGNTFTVSYTTSGPAFSGNGPVDVWLSDANGSFANQRKIGSGTSSPISVTLPGGSGALPYGTNYRLQVVSPQADAESGQSDALAIGNLGYGYVLDKRSTINSYYGGGDLCPGGQAVLRHVAFNVNYNLTAAETYQWLRDGAPISGATSATLAVQQAGSYAVTMQQAGCTITTYSYSVSIRTPGVTVQSFNTNVPQCIGRPASLSANYIGETGTYQWTRDGVDIAGAVSYTLNTNASGQYGYRMTDGGNCTATAQPRQVTIGTSLYARVVRYPANDSVLCAGSSSSVYLSADQLTTDHLNAGGYGVQWYRNNVVITGATEPSYTASQPGFYSFELKQGNCTTRSNGVIVQQGVSVAPVIQYSFRSRNACPGDSRFLYTEGYNSNYSYQWQRDGVDIAGATNNSYTVQSSGSYTIRVTRGNCSATSLPVSLTFSNSIQPVVNFQGSALGICLGQRLYAYDGYQLSNYQYQWFRDGVAIDAQGSASVFVNQSGLYSVRVSNGSCTGLSKGVYVDIRKGGKPTILLNAPSSKVCAQNSVQLTCHGSEGGLQWKRNGVAITGANGYQYYATQSGLYSVVVQFDNCTAESDPVDIKIGEPTAATLTGNMLISSGQATQLPIRFTGPAPWSVTLTSGQSVSAIYQNPYLLPVSPTSTTTYQLATVANACGTGMATGSATVTVGSGSADVALVMEVSNRTPKLNEVVRYNLILTNAGPQESAGVQIRSVLPAGLVFVDSPSAGVSAADGVVTAQAGTLPVGGSTSLSFRAQATQPGVYATAAQVWATQTPDPDSQPGSGTGDGQDDAATADLRTTDASGPIVASANPNQTPLPRVAPSQPVPDAATADLSLAVQASSRTARPGEVVSLSLTVSNRGGSSASSVVVETLLPAGWQLSNSTGFTINGQRVRGYVNQLPAGESAVLVLACTAGNEGSIQAQVQDVAEPDPDSKPGNGYTNGEDDTASLLLRLRP